MLIAKHQSDPGQKTYMLNYRYLLYCTVLLYGYSTVPYIPGTREARTLQYLRSSDPQNLSFFLLFIYSSTMVWAERIEALCVLSIFFTMLASFAAYPGMMYTVSPSFSPLARPRAGVRA